MAGWSVVWYGCGVAVEKELLDGIVIAESRRGAFFDSNVVLPEYLALAEKSHILHGGSHPQALCIFLHAKKMYNDCDSQLLSFLLPYARNPHQLPLQLTVGRWLAKDSAFGDFSIFEQTHISVRPCSLFYSGGYPGIRCV